MTPGVDEEAAAIENKELPPSKPEAVKKVKPPKKDKPPQGRVVSIQSSLICAPSRPHE